MAAVHTIFLYSTRQKIKGFSLAEIVLALGIIGLVIGAIWISASSVYNNQKIEKASSEITTLDQGVRSLYANTSNTGLSTFTPITNIVNSGIIPSDMINGGSMIDPWSNGAAGTYIYSTNTGAKGDGFMIIMANVPISACASLIAAIAGTARDPNLTRAQAVSAITGFTTTTGTPMTTAITPTTAATNCNAVGSSPVMVGFTFKF